MAPQVATPSSALPRGGESAGPAPPTASPLGTSDADAGCLPCACSAQGSRDSLPRSSGPCSDTAN
eukprot:5286675-Pyramimonas_sp.AAC.1